MKAQFKDLKVGTFFTVNGNDWLKRSTRTAYNPWNGTTFYFRQCELVRMITQNVRHGK